MPRVKVCVLISALSALTLSTTSCATATRGRTETLTIESEPSDAHVRLGNGFTGRTPAQFAIIRKDPISVTVSMEGYETVSILLKPNLSGKGTLSSTAGPVTVSYPVLSAGSAALSSGGAALAAVPLLAVTAGVIIVGGIAWDMHSGALLQHASGPLRFILKANDVEPSATQASHPSGQTDPPASP